MLIKSGISGKSLKMIACISMCIDHVGAIILERLVATGTLNIVCRLIGRVSFPIYCFLMAEGIRHTSSKKRYILRLAVFAAISELPYDMAFSGQAFNWTEQNVFFTLCLGLLVLCTLESKFLGNHGRLVRSLWFGIIIIFAGMLNEFLLHGSYGFFGICTIGVAYLFTKKDDAYIAECITLTAMNYAEITSFLALPLIHLYNGERGKSTKWAFYVFYPAHLMILTVIYNMIK